MRRPAVAFAFAAVMIAAPARRALADGAPPGDPCAELAAAPATIDTTLALAACHAAAGRTASAWLAYQDAAAKARAAHDGRADEAERRARELQPGLVSLRVTVDAKSEGLAVFRDGVALGPGDLGVDVALDPGTHIVSAIAPGRPAWVRSIEVRGPDRRHHVHILLDPAGGLVATSAPVTREARPSIPRDGGVQSRRWLTAIGAGLATLTFTVAGASVLAEAAGKRSAANRGHCPDDDCAALRSSAEGEEIGAGIAFALGGVFLGLTIGLGVLIARDTPPATPAPGVHVTALIGPSTAGLALGGSF